MHQKSNTLYFSLTEKKLIKKLLDSKYGMETSPSDYDTTGGDYDVGVEGHIFQNTGEHISGSTIERLTGLRNEKNTGVSLATLTIVAKYLNFGSTIRLLHVLEIQLASNFKNNGPFDLSGLLEKYTICLKFGDNMNFSYIAFHCYFDE
ncbi:MAG: hypothetical protein NT144_00235 [Bacteroidia bacterium]|nr:hypothetical protein [Bacteroidia bacterium]